MADNLPVIHGSDDDHQLPAIAVFRRYANDLRVRAWRNDGSIDMDWPSYSKLILPLDCVRILLAIEASRTPATDEEASYLAKLLVGSFPRETVPDPDTFMLVLGATFREYPADAGRRAIDTLTRKLRFMTSRAELIDELDAAMKPLWYAEHVADTHLKRWRDEHGLRVIKCEGRMIGRPTGDRAPGDEQQRG